MDRSSISHREIVKKGRHKGKPATKKSERAQVPAGVTTQQQGTGGSPGKIHEQPVAEAPVFLVMEEAFRAPEELKAGTFSSGGDRTYFENRTNPAVLAIGAAHPESAGIEKILGRILTEDGLNRFYADSMPGFHCISSVKCIPGSSDIFMSMDLRNGKGELAASRLNVLRRHDDGALELQLGMIEVESPYRGSGLVPRLIQKDISLLRGLSDHRDSRLTLRAAGYVPGSSTRQFGTYVWARYGIFEFSKPSSLEECREKYSSWVDRMAAGRSLDPDTVQKLKALSHSWSHPSHIAGAALQGFKFPVSLEGEPPTMCDAGKAFLMSEDAPAWYGQCRVNQPLSEEAKEGLAVIEEKDSSAEQGRLQRKVDWTHTLGVTADVEAKMAVIDEIGRDGGKEFLPILEFLTHNPALREKARCEMERIEGKHLLTDLSHIFLDRERNERERHSALADFDRLGGRVDRHDAELLLSENDADIRALMFQLFYRNQNVDRHLAIKVAEETLAKTSIPPKGGFRPRSRVLDAIRALMKIKGKEAIPELMELRRAQSDTVVQRTIDDCLASLESGKSTGLAAMPVGEYPPETWA